MTKLILLLAALLVIPLTLTLAPTHKKVLAHKKVAVYGRTLWPTPPPASVVVINKRTALSGEGVFVR